VVEPKGVKRKLAVILAADAVGYTRLMREAEEPTLETLTEYRVIIDGLIARHEGRIFGTAGDSVMSEFDSAVEAIRCAVAIQEELAARNTELADERKLRFRIGIHVGDVMARDDDLFGDGVNVAARLEGLAEPGGVCVSGSVFEQIKHKLSLGFEDIGPQAVKNVAEPVPAFRIVPGQVSVAETVTPASTPGVAARWRLPAIAAGVVAIIAVTGVAIWDAYLRPAPPPKVSAPEEAPAPVLPDKPSIAVLPFANMGGDPEQEYFSDGITDDLITDLSKISGLFVIARNSVFTYKGRAVQVQQVAKELGVRYVLEGSVRRAEGKVRINAQLVDASTGGHLWAERYDRDYREIFALQDEITGNIVSALALELTAGEGERVSRRDTDNVLAYDAFLQGWDHYLRFTREDHAKALPYFEKAVELDPNYGRAYAALARLYHYYHYAWLRIWHVDLGWYDARCQAERHLQLAMKNPTPLAHSVAGAKRIFEQRHEEAIAELERAIALDPTFTDAYSYMAHALALTGRPEDALEAAQKAMRIDPHDLARKLWRIGMARLGMEQYDKAAAAFEGSRSRNPSLEGWPHAATYVHLGRMEEASKTLLDYIRLRGWSQSNDLREALREWGTVGRTRKMSSDLPVRWSSWGCAVRRT
jgi:TolB-like protein/class 3 adenylate cyclase/lipoprotein NlpI